MKKLKSRKFWICVAAFLASVGTSVVALKSDNQIVAAIGTVCTILSAGIYAYAEAWVDSKAIGEPYENTYVVGFQAPDPEDDEENSDE